MAWTCTIPVWEPRKRYQVGDQVLPTISVNGNNPGGAATPGLKIMTVTVAGYSGATEPATWNTASEFNTFADNQVTWRAADLHFIDPVSGNNANDGSQSFPKRSFFGPGLAGRGTLVLRGATEVGGGNISPGAATHRHHIGHYGDDGDDLPVVPRSIILTGTAALGTPGNTTIRGLHLPYGFGISAFQGSDIPQNINILDNQLDGDAANSGITFNRTAGHTEWVGATDLGSFANVRIAGNRIYRAGKYGIGLEGIHVDSNNRRSILIENNVIYEAGYGPLAAWGLSPYARYTTQAVTAGSGVRSFAALQKVYFACVDGAVHTGVRVLVDVSPSTTPGVGQFSWVTDTFYCNLGTTGTTLTVVQATTVFRGITIRNNEVARTGLGKSDRAGIGIDPGVTQCDIIGNKCWSNGDSGITVHLSSDVDIIGNEVWDNGRNGVSVNPFPTRDIQIGPAARVKTYHNTIESTQGRECILLAYGEDHQTFGNVCLGGNAAYLESLTNGCTHDFNTEYGASGARTFNGTNERQENPLLDSFHKPMANSPLISFPGIYKGVPMWDVRGRRYDFARPTRGCYSRRAGDGE